MKQYKAFTAFLDVLGFKEIIKSPDWVKQVTKIKTTLEHVITKTANHNSSHRILPIKALQSIIISDSIILWVEHTDTPYEDVKCLRFLIYCVQQIQYECALENIWIRGGISYGEVLTDGSNIFGQGYINAYLLEQQADFPRVIVDVETLKTVLPNRGADQIVSAVNIDFDCSLYNGKFLFDYKLCPSRGVYFNEDCLFFVDYLSLLEGTEGKFEALLEQINLNLLTRDSKIYRKYKWVEDYIKLSFTSIQDAPSVEQKA